MMNTVDKIPLAKIIPGQDFRADLGDLEGLAESIREHGLLHPIRVRQLEMGAYEIIAGHRRVQACKLLAHSTIDAIVVDEGDARSATQRLVENLQREDLRPIELAHGIEALYKHYDMSLEAIAHSLGKRKEQVRSWLIMSRLPDDVLEKLDSGTSRGTHNVQGATARHIKRFLDDLPEEEPISPSARAKLEERIDTIREFVRTFDEAPINAHQADAAASMIKRGEKTVEEAIVEVRQHPEWYRYSRRIESSAELQEDTWSAYKDVHGQIRVLLNKLRPEVASLFDPPHKRELARDWHSILAKVENYHSALIVEPPRDVGKPKELASGEN